MRVTDHLEHHLGLVEEGWSTNAAGERVPFAVVRLPGGPLEDRKVFATVGLSDHILRSKSSSKPIRQELIFIAPASFGDRSIPALLQQVGMQALEGHTALLRGEVLGPHGRLFKTGEMEALYVSIQGVLAGVLCGLQARWRWDRDPGLVVPVSGAEATLVKRHGWEAFENEIVKNDPDLSDPERRNLLIAAASPN
jgi:Suppressor of fused protein (SUFU)